MCSFLRFFSTRILSSRSSAISGTPFSVDSAHRLFSTLCTNIGSVYNFFYTSLPVFAVGIFDQDVSDKNSILYPQLYRPRHIIFFNKEFLLSALQRMLCLSSIIFSSITLMLSVQTVKASRIICCYAVSFEV